MVFKLRLKDGLTAMQLSKIPKQLLGESEVDRFLRVTAVTSQKASLSLYQSRARAVDDNRGELLAPMVTAATLSHLGVVFVQESGSRYWRELDDGGEDEEEEERRLEAEADGEAAAAEAAAAGDDGGEDDEAVTPVGQGEMAVLIMKKVGISDPEAAQRLISTCGVRTARDLEELRGAGEELALALSGEAYLSLMDKHKLNKFMGMRPTTLAARGGGSSAARVSTWLAQVGDDDAASDVALTSSLIGNESVLRRLSLIHI